MAFPHRFIQFPTEQDTFAGFCKTSSKGTSKNMFKTEVTVFNLSVLSCSRDVRRYTPPTSIFIIEPSFFLSLRNSIVLQKQLTTNTILFVVNCFFLKTYV